LLTRKYLLQGIRRNFKILLSIIGLLKVKNNSLFVFQRKRLRFREIFLNYFSNCLKMRDKKSPGDSSRGRDMPVDGYGAGMVNNS